MGEELSLSLGDNIVSDSGYAYFFVSLLVNGDFFGSTLKTRELICKKGFLDSYSGYSGIDQFFIVGDWLFWFKGKHGALSGQAPFPEFRDSKTD